MKLTARVFQELKLKYNPQASKASSLVKNQTLPAKLADSSPSLRFLSFKDMKFARQICENLPNLNINWKYPTKNQCKMLNVLKSNYSVSCNLDSGSGKTTALLLYCLDLKFKRTRINRNPHIFSAENSGVISPRSILLVNNSNSVISLKNKIESMFRDTDAGFGSEYLPMIKYLYRSTPDEETKQVESLILENDSEIYNEYNIYNHQPCHMIIATPQRLNDILSFDMSVLPSLKYLKFIGVDDVELQVNNSSIGSKRTRKNSNKFGDSQGSNHNCASRIKSTSCELFFDKLILPKLKSDKNVFLCKYDKNGRLQKPSESSETEVESDGIQTAFVNSFDHSGSLQKIIQNLNEAVSKSRKLLRIENINHASSMETTKADSNAVSSESVNLPMNLTHLNFKTYVLTIVNEESTKSVKLVDVNIPDFPKSEAGIIAELNQYQDFEETYRRNFKKSATQKSTNNDRKTDAFSKISIEQNITTMLNLSQLPLFEKDNILFVFPDSYSIVNLFEKLCAKIVDKKESGSLRAINLNSLGNIPTISNSKRNLAFINLHNLKGVNFPYQGLNFQTIVIIKPIDILLQNFKFNLPLILTRCMRDEEFPNIGILNLKEQFDYLVSDIASDQKKQTTNGQHCNGKIVLLNGLDGDSLDVEDSMYIYRKLLHGGVKHCDAIIDK